MIKQMITFYVLLLFLAQTTQAKQCINSVLLSPLGYTEFTQESCFDTVKSNLIELGCTGDTYQYNVVNGDCACATDD